MSDLVEIGVEAMLETDLGKMLLARHEARTLLSAALTDIEKAGYRVVPADATVEMVDAARPLSPKESIWTIRRMYDAMLSAAPKVA